MQAKPIPFDEQMKLIMECRSSGLSDHQWCLEHDIKPGTFYNWVKRHRQKACSIPARAQKHVPQNQDVVRMDPVSLQQPDSETFLNKEGFPDSGTAMELAVNDVTVRVTNDIRPKLLAQTLRILKEMSC